MITSKLSKKARTTIPLPVRRALRLTVGDYLVYTIEADRVLLGTTSRDAASDPFAIFAEWSTEADRVGYADL